MKALLAILLLWGLSANASERNWYRIYLNSKVESTTKYAALYNSRNKISLAPIPRFERPKGAIFCRMEDYLTAKTKVWIKVGVK